MATFPVDPPFSTEDGDLVCPAPIYEAKRGTTLLQSVTIYGQRPTASMPAGGPSVIRIPLMTPNGKSAVIAEPDDVCGDPEIEAKIGDAVIRLPSDAVMAVDDDRDSILVALPSGYAGTPGIYEVEGRILDGTGNMLAYGRAYAYVERSFWQGDNYGGPPSIDEVRGAIRDFVPANRLLGDYEFSASEIAEAVVRTINRFNAAPPNLGTVGTSNWPFTYTMPLIDGILAELFEVAAAYFRRGHLPYSAGNLSIDDMAKEKDYINAAMIYRQRFDEWMKMTRQRLNMELAFGSIGSIYSAYGYW